MDNSGEIRELAREGVNLCRMNDWKRGYEVMKPLFRQYGRSDRLEPVFLSYFGYAQAGFEGKYNDGVKLCKLAIEREFYQPENYLNLARTYLLLDAKRRALDAIQRGLKIESEHPELLQLRRELGERKPRVLSFLSRSHPLNRLLGKLRGQPPKPKTPFDQS